MVVLLVYVNDFCYYRNCLYTTGTGTALRKNKSMRVPVQYIVYSIDSLTARTLIRIRQSGRTGIGRDTSTTSRLPRPSKLITTQPNRS